MSKSMSISFDDLVRETTPKKVPRPTTMDLAGEQILARYGEKFYEEYLTTLIGNRVPATVIVDILGGLDIEDKPRGVTTVKEYRNRLRLLAEKAGESA